MKIYLTLLILTLSLCCLSQRVEDDNITSLSMKNYTISNLKSDSIEYIVLTFRNLDKTTTPDYKTIVFSDTLEFQNFLNTILTIIEGRGETSFDTDNFSVQLKWSNNNACEIIAYGGYCYLRKCDIVEYINSLN